MGGGKCQRKKKGEQGSAIDENFLRSLEPGETVSERCDTIEDFHLPVPTQGEGLCVPEGSMHTEKA